MVRPPPAKPRAWAETPQERLDRERERLDTERLDRERERLDRERLERERLERERERYRQRELPLAGAGRSNTATEEMMVSSSNGVHGSSAPAGPAGEEPFQELDHILEWLEEQPLGANSAPQQAARSAEEPRWHQPVRQQEMGQSGQQQGREWQPLSTFQLHTRQEVRWQEQLSRGRQRRPEPPVGRVGVAPSGAAGPAPQEQTLNMEDLLSLGVRGQGAALSQPFTLVPMDNGEFSISLGLNNRLHQN
jgi:hypothetical protein